MSSRKNLSKLLLQVIVSDDIVLVQERKLRLLWPRLQNSGIVVTTSKIKIKIQILGRKISFVPKIEKSVPTTTTLVSHFTLKDSRLQKRSPALQLLNISDLRGQKR